MVKKMVPEIMVPEEMVPAISKLYAEKNYLCNQPKSTEKKDF